MQSLGQSLLLTPPGNVPIASSSRSGESSNTTASRGLIPHPMTSSGSLKPAPICLSDTRPGTTTPATCPTRRPTVLEALHTHPASWACSPCPSLATQTSTLWATTCPCPIARLRLRTAPTRAPTGRTGRWIPSRHTSKSTL